jgi:hypothetical protein
VKQQPKRIIGKQIFLVFSSFLAKTFFSKQIISPTQIYCTNKYIRFPHWLSKISIFGGLLAYVETITVHTIIKKKFSGVQVQQNLNFKRLKNGLMFNFTPKNFLVSLTHWQILTTEKGRFQWPRGLRRGSAAACLQVLRFRTPSGGHEYLSWAFFFSHSCTVHLDIIRLFYLTTDEQ